MAATNRNITEHIVLNGASILSQFGKFGENPMRYIGGLWGGTYQFIVWSNLSGGKFSGAWLSTNFEQFKPLRNYVSKSFDLYQDPVGGRELFTCVERWEVRLSILNEQESRLIFAKLFFGKNLANKEHVEMKSVIGIPEILMPSSYKVMF